MRIITWNIRRATKDSPVWKLLLELQPDIALLQEVGNIPDKIEELFDVLSKPATYKTGKPQKFSTAVLVKGKIIKEINLLSEYEGVNNAIEFFKGNFIACVVELQNHEKFNVVSVYSPAWVVDKNMTGGQDISAVKLKENPRLWPTELLWSALKNSNLEDTPWIVGGDYNSSETFDKYYKLKHGLKGGLVTGGNKEIRDRMYDLGFKECLLEGRGKLTPTYKHTNGQIIHQLDHLYVTNKLCRQLLACDVGNKKILDESISDHLPIMADFSEKIKKLHQKK